MGPFKLLVGSNDLKIAVGFVNRAAQRGYLRWGNRFPICCQEEKKEKGKNLFHGSSHGL